MASRLGYSEFNNEPDNSNKPNKRKNKTVRKKRLEEQAPKVTSFLKAMEDGGKDEASDGLADFNPPANPELTKQPGPVQEVKTNDDQSLNIKAFENLDNFTPQREYMDSYIPYYTKAANDAHAYGNKEPLLDKLNYLIHLMEENKDERTQNVTEELVLYMFLGVFVIFVVDSFARAGKYTR